MTTLNLISVFYKAQNQVNLKNVLFRHINIRNNIKSEVTASFFGQGTSILYTGTAYRLSSSYRDVSVGLPHQHVL